MGIKILIGGNSQYLNPAVSLAMKVYKKEDVSPLAVYKEMHDRNPNAFVFAIDDRTHELVGYVINIPLEKSYFESTNQASYDESDLTPDRILQFKKGMNYIYMFSIVINPGYTDRVPALRALVNGVREQFNSLAQDGKYITQASAVALSDSGIKLCQGMKMTEIGVNKKGTVFIHKSFHTLFANDATKSHILKTFVQNKNQAA
jgi:hypothetical protein